MKPCGPERGQSSATSELYDCLSQAFLRCYPDGVDEYLDRDH
ncbi:hypothetical protein [Micromonospora sp. NPDC005173]